MSLPPEILKKVKLLDIRTRKLVNNLLAGEYHTAFRGQGMTFAEFREYEPGDDVRAISWPLTARMGRPFIKKFEEERELTLLLMVDVSGSGDFGTGEYLKGEVIAHLAALLGFAASKNNDPVGLVLFSDRVEHFVPPKKGRGHVYRMLRDLYYFKPESRQTQIATALDFARGILSKRSSIFIFSDFIDQGFESSLRLLGQKHDVISVLVKDPMEVEIPKMGLIDIHDPETGEILTVDTSSYSFQKDFKAEVERKNSVRQQMLKKARVDIVEVDSEKDITEPLIGFFKRRNRR